MRFVVNLASQTMPKRIQLSRRAGWRMPENTVKVDRSTKWGNPIRPGQPCIYSGGRPVADKRHAWRIYQALAPENAVLVAAARAELRGFNLGCWCGLCEIHAGGREFGVPCDACDPCHADVLGEIANGR